MGEVFPRIKPVGEFALLLELGDAINHQINQWILSLDHHLRHRRIAGVIEWIPAYSSILVLYDPAQTTGLEVRMWLEDCLNNQEKQTFAERRRIDISVKYGGEEGPDLDFVADYHGLTTAQVVEKHASQVYMVAMMGFTPGFAYLMGLGSDLATPRLVTPRTMVPAGSVGIAGQQTGIYPLDSPGGWQIIGKTEQSLFNPNHEPYFMLSPGDQVRFIPTEGGRV